LCYKIGGGGGIDRGRKIRKSVLENKDWKGWKRQSFKTGKIKRLGGVGLKEVSSEGGGRKIGGTQEHCLHVHVF